MKILSKALYLLAAVCFVGFTSCKQVEETFEPGPEDLTSCYRVYFPSQEVTNGAVIVQNPLDPTSITITVARKNTTGAITVPYTATFSDESVLSAGDIKFADGQTETTFDLVYPNAKEGTVYTASFKIEDENYAARYGEEPVGCDISFMRVAYQNFSDEDGNPIKVTFTQNWWGQVHSAYIKYYEVDGIRHCETFDEEGDLSGEEEPGPGFWGTGDYHLSFVWNSKTNYIDIPEQTIGWDYDGAGSWVKIYDRYNYYNIINSTYAGSWATADEFYSKNDSQLEYRSYYDGNGGVFLYVEWYYIIGLGGWHPATFDMIGIGEGFVRVDYSIKLQTDFSEDGQVPVLFKLGADVSEVKYAVVESALSETMAGNVANAIIEGTQADVQSFVPASTEEVLNLTLPATGTYTLVAVTYGPDEDGKVEARENAYTSFNYVAAGDTSYDIDLNVSASATPARYEKDGLNALNSFSYLVYAEDLTDAKIAVYTEATLQKYGSDVVIADLKEKSSVSEDILAEINSTKGYSTIVSGLNPDTRYYVIVWATNDYQEKVVAASYKTDPLPYEWNLLGTGEYTDDVACGLYGIDPFPVSCTVYEEKTHPGLYKLADFQLPLLTAIFMDEGDDYDELYELFETEYKDVYWRPAEIIIDATDASNVTIALQDYGVCLNTSDGFIDGVTSVYNGNPFSVGTLENGVIAYPTVKGLLCTLNGEGYYYANQHGAFKLVLPAANAAPAVTKAPVRKSGKLSLGNFKASEVRTLSVGRMESFSIEFEGETKSVAVTATPGVSFKANRTSKIERAANQKL